MKNIVKSMLAAGAVFAVVSCNVDAIGTLYENSGSDTGVTFARTVATDTEVPASETTYTIPVTRAVADAAQTVSVSTTLSGDIAVPASVSFAPGVYTADLVLDISRMAVGSMYRGTISLADASAYDANTAISSISVSFAKAYEWVSLGTGQFLELFWEGFLADVEILKADGFDIYRVLNPYAEAVEDATGPKPAYIQFEVVDNKGTVHFNTWQSPYDYSGEGDYIKFYRPSEGSASYAGYDDASMLADKYFVALMPYVYIDGLGGWNVSAGHCIGIALPGAPKGIDDWFSENGLL